MRVLPPQRSTTHERLARTARPIPDLPDFADCRLRDPAHADVTAHSATVIALAPFCAERFRAQGDAPAKMAELAKASTWERTTVVEKSGFAVLPGTKSNDSDIARACVELLLAPATPKT